MSTYIGTKLRCQGGHLILGGVQFSTQLADLERKNAEEKRVEKRKKKAQMKRRGKGGTHKGSRCVVERELCDLVSEGETVCRCMDRIEVCCTGGCKDHRDVR